jgi:hypothetical protein
MRMIRAAFPLGFKADLLRHGIGCEGAGRAGAAPSSCPTRHAIGAATTALALAIIISAKFTECAWITVLVIPSVILLLQAIKRYYEELEMRLRDDGLSLAEVRPPIVLVTKEGWEPPDG